METRLITPKELAGMLGVCTNTAMVHMRNHPRCINVGLGSKEYLRLPLDAAEEIVSGIRPLSPIADKPRQAPPKAKPKPRRNTRQATHYVAYR